MDWRSIKNDPPTPGTGIRATDGKSVFVGQIRPSDIPDHTWFMGTGLDDGSQICLAPDELTEWMPLENQPENFTQKVERIISEIRDMIGEKMYYGEMVGAPGPYCNCGPMVYEDPEDYNLEKAADILQGALDGVFLGDPDLMPEETADKTLHELGYEKTESSSGYPMYEDKHGVAIEIAVKADCIAKYHRDPYVPGCVPMTVKEHLAVARLIEETEESK